MISSIRFSVSALNRIIRNIQYKKKGQSGGTKSPKRGPFPSRKTDRSLDLRVLPEHGSQRFCRELCRPIYYFSSKWWYSGIRFKMGWNSIVDDTNPFWWRLGKLLYSEYESLRNSIPYWNCTIWRFIRRKLVLIITDWKRWKNKYRARFYELGILGARNGNYERNAVVKNQGTKQRGLRILGDCWQRESNGQYSKGNNCSFRHVFNKRAKMTQPNPSPNSFMQQSERKTSRTRSPRGKSPSGSMSRCPCKDYLKRTCTNSFCESGTLQNAFSTRPRVVADLEKSARMHIVRLMTA